MTTAVLSFGANLGDRRAALSAAVHRFEPFLVVVSTFHETPPWGDEDQPAYLNAVAVVDDPAATAADWLARAQDAERAAGRVRDPARRYGPRSLDVDVIAVWNGAEPVVSDDTALTLPHPRAHERAFVLVPWYEIQPDAVLPGHGPIRDLLARLPGG